MFKRDQPHHRHVDWARSATDLSLPMHLQALEPRVLLDAAAAATAAAHVPDHHADGVQAAHDAQASTAELAQALEHANPPAAQPAAPPAAMPAAAAPAAPAATAPAVYFVEHDLPDVAQLVAALPANAEVHYIEPGTDGVKDIAQALAGRTGIGAIHILAHGSAGELDLGTAVLTTASMQGQYHDDLVTIGNALAVHGDILIYGCDFSAGDIGLQAANTLANITHADIAASTNDTGAASLGGDWVLETHIGVIDTKAVAAPDWNHELAANTPTIIPWTSDSTQDGKGVGTITLTPTAGGTARVINIAMDSFTGPGASNGGVSYGVNYAASPGSDSVATGAVNGNGVQSLAVNASSNGTSYPASISFTSPTGGAVTLVDPIILLNFVLTGYTVTFTGVPAANITILDDNVGAVVNGSTVSFTAGAGNGASMAAIRLTGNYTNSIPFTTSNTTVNGSVGMNLLVNNVDVALSSNQVPAAQAATEDVPRVFSTANGNAIQVVDIDGDLAGQNPITTITLTGTNGTMTLSGIAGLTFSVGDGTSDGAMTFFGTRSAVNAALNGMSFTGTQDFSGTGTVQIASAVAGDATGTHTNSVTLNIAAANDAPVLDPAAAAPALPAVNEDSALPSGAVGLLVSGIVGANVTDVDAGAVKGIAITGADATNGTWYYSINSGSTWTAIGAVSNASALLLNTTNTRVYFRPNADFNGTVDPGLTFRAWDTTSGTNGTLASTAVNGGTTAFSAATDTVSASVTAVNDAPVNNLPAAAWTTNEDANVLLPGLSVTDVDAAGGTITVTFSVTSGTLFSPAGGGVNVTGNLTSSVTLSGTLSNINSLLAGGTPLVFTPVKDFNGSVTLTMLTNDGGNTGTGGALTDSDTKTITVVAVNDAPVLDPAAAAPALPSVLEDAAVPTGGVGLLVSAIAGANVTDVDSGAVKGIAITAADTANGTWYYSINNGSTWLVMPAVSDANALLLTNAGSSRVFFRPGPNFNGSVDPGLTFRAWDTTSGTNGGVADTRTNGTTTAFSLATDTVSASVTAVNDAPVNTLPATFTTNEDTPLTLTGLSVADVDSAAGVISVQFTVASGSLSATSGAGVTATASNRGLTLTLSGTLADINAYLASALAPVYTPDANINGPVTLTMLTNDGGNTGTGGALTDSETSTITIVAVNDPPILSLAGDVVVNGSFENGGQAWSTNSSLFETNPVSSYGAPASGAGTKVLEVEGAAMSPQSTPTWDQTTFNTVGGQTYRLSFIATKRNGNTADFGFVAAEGVTLLNFTTTSAWNTYTVTFTATDATTFIRFTSIGSSGGSFVQPGDGVGLLLDDVQVRPVDTPYLTTYTENGPAVAIAPTPGILDVDNANMASAKVVIGNGVAGDVLSVVGALPAGITASYDAASFTLTLSGSATKANYNTALSQVFYQSTSDDPPAAARSILVTVNDGSADSNTAVTSVAIVQVNDAPVNTLPAAGYSGAQNRGIALTGLSVADVDAESGTISVQLSVSGGTLAAASGAGVTVANSGTASLTLSGTLASINAYLASSAAPVYSPAANATGGVTLTMLTNDGGNTGGGALTDTDTTTITVLLDSDGDGVPDVTDIDDDNDGILDTVENTLPPSLVDGSNEGAVGVAWTESTNTASLNGNITGTGWTPVAGTPDTWKGPFSLTGTGFWAGAMNGVPGAADGQVFIGLYGGSADETMTRTIPVSAGIQVGDKVQINYNEIFGGVAGLTPVGQSTNFIFTIDGVAYQGASMTYTGNVPKTWTADVITFTATTNSPKIVVSIKPTGEYNYLGFDSFEVRKVAAITAAQDPDGDGLPNSLDLDSDNDGIPDNIEAQTTAGYIAPSGQGAAMTDVDRDGLDDRYDANTASTDPTLSKGLTPVNTDAAAPVPDAIPDYLDPDSDNDGTPDIAERRDGLPTTITSTTDTDHDGLLDIFEGGTPNNGYKVTGAVYNGTTFTLADTDGDTTPTGAGAVPLSADFDYRDNTNRPFIDLNSVASAADTARNNTVNYSDGAPAVKIATAAADVNDAGENDLLTMHIQVASGILDGAAEILTIGGIDFPLNANSTRTLTVGATTFSAAYTTPGGFTITRNGGGAMPQADLDTLVRGIAYRDTLGHVTTGNRTLIFDVVDSTGLVSPAAVATIAVTSNNTAPVAVDDTFSTNEDTSLALPLVANDTDANNDPLSVYSVNGVTLSGGVQAVIVPHGVVLVAANGTLSFQPTADYNGPVTFDYVVQDGFGGQDTGTVNITVIPVNDAPVNHVPGTQTVDEDTSLAFTGAQLISVNDVDGNLATTRLTVNSGTLTVSLAGGATVSAGANGTQALTLSGTQAQINAALATLGYPRRRTARACRHHAAASQRPPRRGGAPCLSGRLLGATRAGEPPPGDDGCCVAGGVDLSRSESRMGARAEGGGYAPPRMSPGLRPPPLFRCGGHPPPSAQDKSRRAGRSTPARPGHVGGVLPPRPPATVAADTESCKRRGSFILARHDAATHHHA
ncbi:DUF4347 domain-containing protein [Variovorax sp. dw_308]|uniref:DUF4347 domain-containing protein n=1 Tax=Variovorax sp. dw_308 TaxID=2721546 RepID=UPI001C44E1D0|nr:DUF4347 domain-containing protein [Variovorax sp. dw_308]